MRKATLASTAILIGLAACADAKQGGGEEGDASNTTQSSNSSCANAVEVVAQGIGKSGVLELLTPIKGWDGSGYTSAAHDLADGTCIEREILERLFQSSGVNSNEYAEVLVGYDPTGLAVHDGYRSRLDIEGEFGAFDPTAHLPKDMKFGEARWNASMSELVIEWYGRDHDWFAELPNSNSAANAKAENTSPNQNSGSLSTTAVMNGTCKKLLIGDADATALCEPSVINAAYTNGKSSFTFIASEKAVVGFFGTDNAAQGNRAVLQVEQITLNLMMGTPSKSTPAKGTCTYTNPYAGPASIQCSAVALGKTFSASFVSDGKEPIIEQF